MVIWWRTTGIVMDSVSRCILHVSFACILPPLAVPAYPVVSWSSLCSGRSTWRFLSPFCFGRTGDCSLNQTCKQWRPLQKSRIFRRRTALVIQIGQILANAFKLFRNSRVLGYTIDRILDSMQHLNRQPGRKT